MRIVKAIVLGLIAWFVLTTVVGVGWIVLGLPSEVIDSTLFDFALLPLGLWIGWMITGPPLSASRYERQLRERMESWEE